MDSKVSFTIPSIVVEATPTKDADPTIVRISHEEASKFRVGDPIDLHLSGTVKSIRDVSMNDQPNKMAEIELSSPEISSVAMNPADFEMKRQIGD